jgi:hypothetical protein
VTVQKRNVEYEPNFLAGFLAKAGTIVASMLGSEAVTAGKIASGAIASGDIKAGAITTGLLANGNIINEKISNGTIAEEKLAIAVQNKLNPTGAWTALESVSAKIEPVTGNLTPDVRLDMPGVARLRGVYEVKTLESVASATKLFTVPAAFSPSSIVNVPTVWRAATVATVAYLKVQTNGEVLYEGATLSAGNGIVLDGVTWSIT